MKDKHAVLSVVAAFVVGVLITIVFSAVSSVGASTAALQDATPVPTVTPEAPTPIPQPSQVQVDVCDFDFNEAEVFITIKNKGMCDADRAAEIVLAVDFVTFEVAFDEGYQLWVQDSLWAVSLPPELRPE